jgi:hypothetical protein
MNESTYRILDFTHSGRWPLWVLAHDNLAEIVNRRKGHELAHTTLVETLHTAYYSGWIDARLYKNDDWEHQHPIDIELNPLNIEKGLMHELNIYYGLSASGGAEWETLSKPKWRLYIDSGISHGDLTVRTSSRRNAQLEIATLPYIWQEVAIPNTAEWQLLTPWQATYWKTLPRGWQLKCQTIESDDPNNIFLSDMPCRLRALKDKFWNWYTNPFDAAIDSPRNDKD